MNMRLKDGQTNSGKIEHFVVNRVKIWADVLNGFFILGSQGSPSPRRWHIA